MILIKENSFFLTAVIESTSPTNRKKEIEFTPSEACLIKRNEASMPLTNKNQTNPY